MKSFIEFVASQPRDKKINHHSWHSCAIGDFADSMDQLPTRGCYSFTNHMVHVNPGSWSPQMEICVDSLREMYIPNTDGDLTIYDVLGEGYIDPDEYNGHEVETYGGLMKLIQWCIKEQ